MNGILIRVPSFTFNSDPIEYCFSTDVNYKKKRKSFFLSFKHCFGDIYDVRFHLFSH